MHVTPTSQIKQTQPASMIDSFKQSNIFNISHFSQQILYHMNELMAVKMAVDQWLQSFHMARSGLQLVKCRKRKDFQLNSILFVAFFLSEHMHYDSKDAQKNINFKAFVFSPLNYNSDQDLFHYSCNIYTKWGILQAQANERKMTTSWQKHGYRFKLNPSIWCDPNAH